MIDFIKELKRAHSGKKIAIFFDNSSVHKSKDV